MPRDSSKVTMAQVAEAAGVSKATVSRVLGGSLLIGDEVRREVTEIADELGYVKRRHRRHAERSILTVKLVLPESQTQAAELFYSFGQLNEGLREGLEPSGVNVLVENNSARYQPYSHKKGGEIDAFVFAFHRPSSEVLAEIEQHSAPCIVLNRIVDGVRQVVSDHEDAFLQIASHLAERGVTGDCCFIGYQGIEDVWKARLKGFEEGAREQGIDFDPIEDVCLVESLQQLDEQAVKAQIDRGVTSFVGVNDVAAAVVMQHLTNLGLKIPTEIKVTGCDSGPLSDITYPKLTTVDLSIKSLAREVGQLLQAEIVEKRPTQLALMVKGHLSVGGST